jgi:aminoglycoside phosphotransferase (APT) family kinase protein
VNLEDCLPAALRGTITPVAVGFSGAGVYRVETADAMYILKISDEPVDAWRRKLRVQELAVAAGVTPRIVHVDEARRAVVTELVVDRSFPMLFMTPATRDAAIALLGRTLRRVHDVPLPADLPALDPLALLGSLTLPTLPPFAADAIAQIVDETPPPSDRAPVLSHNDVNPTNLVYDGARLLLVDWNTAAPNDPLYDLAAIAVFLRMDEATCAKLVAAHDDAAPTELPPRFRYLQRLVAVVCGALFLNLARQGGHAGSTNEEPEPLEAFYQRLRAGQTDVAAATGKWEFGLALIGSAKRYL